MRQLMYNDLLVFVRNNFFIKNSLCYKDCVITTARLPLTQLCVAQKLPFDRGGLFKEFNEFMDFTEAQFPNPFKKLNAVWAHLGGREQLLLPPVVEMWGEYAVLVEGPLSVARDIDMGCKELAVIIVRPVSRRLPGFPNVPERMPTPSIAFAECNDRLVAGGNDARYFMYKK